jgi:methionyl-tRNA synthetase
MLHLDQKLVWDDVETRAELLSSGHKIDKAQLLFEKIEDVEIQAQIDKLEASKKANEMANRVVEPQKDTVTFEDFSKLDIRSGTILSAEKMPKAKKLLVLQVDTGIDVRTIVSGIAEHFAPETLIGQRVSVLVNLAPRKLRGVESQGMILMSDTAEGGLAFVQADSNFEVSNGEQLS